MWQALLGLRFVPGAVEIAPRLPKTWPGFSVTLAHGDFRLRIEVRRAKPAAVLPVRIPWPPERSEMIEIGAGE